MTDAVLTAAEDSVAKMIGTSFSGVAPAVASEEISHFDFDAEFQTKVAAFALRDDSFVRSCGHLLRPEFFERVGEAALVNIALRHFKQYNSLPDKSSLMLLIKDDCESKVIRGEAQKDVIKSFKALLEFALLDREFVADRVALFVRHQAMSAAILKSVDHLNRGDFDKIEKLVAEATAIGVNNDGEEYDYFARIAERTDERLDKASGKRPPQGITTGIPKMDDLLYHKGWGRKELSSIMGGAKAGKSTALINFAKSASIAGHNVLHVTLEMSASIVSDRLDACLSETLMNELGTNILAVRTKVEAIAAIKHGALRIHEFPSGTLTPGALRQLVERYKASGRDRYGVERPPIKFDLIVVDYADIMSPNHRTDNAIENSKSVYIDLRALATEENLAVLTATQTNRVGFMAPVAKAEHASDDFNKVRTVDLLISINKTEEEAKRGEARLYFAASRNQAAGFSIHIKQRLEMMRFVEAVLGIE